MVDIDVTFGMHCGHPYTYQLYMSDGEKELRWLFDPKELKCWLQKAVKYGLKMFEERKDK